MVVLSRKSRESVVVGAANPFERLLKVTVLEIGDGRVTLGFEVDPDVPVESADAWERIIECDRPVSPTTGLSDEPF
jgi:sRNA-binding carbon storage regulator CsrA